MKKKNEIISLCEVAIFAAIGFVLDFAANLYSGFIFPSGGSLSFALIAVVIISLIIAIIVLLIKIKEPKLLEEMKDDLELGECREFSNEELNKIIE